MDEHHFTADTNLLYSNESAKDINNKDEAIKNEKLSRTNCVSIFDSHWRYGC